MTTIARRRLSLAQARRVTLAAQGFGRLDRPVGLRDVQRVITRLGQFQIDTINIVQRAHYLPLYSRLGGYDIGLLDRAAYRPPRRVFEYWGHAASLIDVTVEPALRWRMAAPDHAWSGVVRLARDHPDLVEQVYAEVAARGPIGARAIEHEEQRSRDAWGWNWSAVKTALEWLLWCGRVTSARRNGQFERLYDLPERVLPRAVRDAPTPDDAEAMQLLVARAARALGIASVHCLADYFRTPVAATLAAVTELEAQGLLLPAAVGDLREPWWLWHEARVPRRTDVAALVSPFDSLVFERDRLQALFGVFYRIEIYVPEPKRQYGYYVYLFVLGDRIVGRVDLKAHRARGVLEVRAAWIETFAADRSAAVAYELAAELHRLARWLGLGEVEVADRGDLAGALRMAVGRTGSLA